MTDLPSPTVRAYFNVTGRTYAELVEYATEQAEKFSGGRSYRLEFDTFHARVLDTRRSPSGLPHHTPPSAEQLEIVYSGDVHVTVPAPGYAS